MQLSRPLVRLPRRYCAETLAAEVAALPASAWIPHPGKLPGNDAVPLVTPGGAVTNAFAGAMAPTEHLRACPYIMAIMADLGAVWGRSRLMGLAACADVPAHVDVGYYWRTHLRIHIPIVTSPKVQFTCDGETVHMAPGECWVFDSFKMHNVRNAGVDKRVHLVLDTVGGETLSDLVAEGEQLGNVGEPAQIVPLAALPTAPVAYERVNAPEVMSPWEVRCHLTYLLDQVPSATDRTTVTARLERFADNWAGAWAQYGTAPDGAGRYRTLIDQARTELRHLGAEKIVLPNRVPLDRALNELIFMVAGPDAQDAARRPALD